MARSPNSASTTNHSTMMGPNQAPTWAVPRRCTMNKPTMMAIDNGTM